MLKTIDHLVAELNAWDTKESDKVGIQSRIDNLRSRVRGLTRSLHEQTIASCENHEYVFVECLPALFAALNVKIISAVTSICCLFVSFCALCV